MLYVDIIIIATTRTVCSTPAMGREKNTLAPDVYMGLTLCDKAGVLRAELILFHKCHTLHSSMMTITAYIKMSMMLPVCFKFLCYFLLAFALSRSAANESLTIFFSVRSFLPKTVTLMYFFGCSFMSSISNPSDDVACDRF